MIYHRDSWWEQGTNLAYRHKGFKTGLKALIETKS